MFYFTIYLILQNCFGQTEMLEHFKLVVKKKKKALNNLVVFLFLLAFVVQIFTKIVKIKILSPNKFR